MKVQLAKLKAEQEKTGKKVEHKENFKKVASMWATACVLRWIVLIEYHDCPFFDRPRPRLRSPPSSSSLPVPASQPFLHQPLL
jgi:hypothetical protein